MTPANTHNPPLTVPDRASIDAARQVATDVLNQACGLAWYAGVMADTYPTVMQDAEKLESFKFALNAWRQVAVESLGRLDALVAEGNKIITPSGLFYDRFSSGPVTIAQRTYPNAHVAAVETGHRTVVITGQTRTSLSQFTAESCGADDPVICLVNHAGDLRRGVVEELGPNYANDVTAWLALIRLESAKATSALPPPTPALSGTEQMIVDALRHHGQPLTQEKLLHAANLGPHGSNKALLAAMRDRGVLTNKGKGYGLPEWEK